MYDAPFTFFEISINARKTNIIQNVIFSIFEHSAEQDSNLLFDQQKVCDSPYPIYESNVYLATFFFVVILKLSPKKLILSRFYPTFIWIKKVKTYTRNVTAASMPTRLINKKSLVHLTFVFRRTTERIQTS